MAAKQEVVLNAENPQWQREAVRLAHQKTPFVVTGIGSPIDQFFKDGLRVAYNLEITVNAKTHRAYFTPRSARHGGAGPV